MRINVTKLADMGFKVDFDENEEFIDIYPERHSESLHKQVRLLGEMLNFNARETDELFGTVSDLTVVNAVRRCL